MEICLCDYLFNKNINSYSGVLWKSKYTLCLRNSYCPIYQNNLIVSILHNYTPDSDVDMVKCLTISPCKIF